MKKRYLDLMEKALSAYSVAHIDGYFARVREEGLTEHGFARLTANIGILISRGRRRDLLPRFLEMMEFCCKTIPTVKAANDFTVREIVCCIRELEGSDAVSAQDLARWKAYFATIRPDACYSIFVRSMEDKANNWSLFSGVSEYFRSRMLSLDDLDFTELQLEYNLHLFDENGMYMDNLASDVHQPMMYDLVPRGLFVLLLNEGYRGRFYKQIDAVLKKAALLTLKMQSPNGEVAFGGRSNQMLNNEAWLALLYEYEAKRYAREGNMALAKEFKAATDRALAALERWLLREPIRHVKNRFPTETGFGCEKYAYFDKYMITVASFLYAAYLVCDESVLWEKQEDLAPCVWQSSYHFHKLFVKCGGYGLAFDLNADPHYDATGLGRVHRAGAPSALCLSVPCPGDACCRYALDRPDRIPFSLCAGVREGEGWCFATGADTTYEVAALSHTQDSATATVLCRFANQKTVKSRYTVSENGVLIENFGEGEIAFALPALAFDGEVQTRILATGQALEIRYGGWVCCYRTNGRIEDLGGIAQNRNGNYRTFAALGHDALRIEIELREEV